MRKAAGLTQAQVAEMLGVSQARVSKICECRTRRNLGHSCAVQPNPNWKNSGSRNGIALMTARNTEPPSAVTR
jgi:hypothetical protein